MKILIVGGTGHIGSYLAPRLIQAGHDVQVIARHPNLRYADLDSTLDIEWTIADRVAEEAGGVWGDRMKGVEADVVIDLICYDINQQRLMFESFHERVQQFIHCGTIWAYGPSDRLPYQEKYERRPITSYGQNKLDVERFLLEMHSVYGFPCTIIHPGHISGRQWLPIDPQGTRNGVQIYNQLASGMPVVLPDLGMATLHHVHADDLAQIFEAVITHRDRAIGEVFSAAAPYAMSLAGCCRHVARYFNKNENLTFVPANTLSGHLGEAAANIAMSHISHSPCVCISKAQSMLGYNPRYTIEDIYDECIEYLVDSGQIHIF